MLARGGVGARILAAALLPIAAPCPIFAQSLAPLVPDAHGRAPPLARRSHNFWNSDAASIRSFATTVPDRYMGPDPDVPLHREIRMVNALTLAESASKFERRLQLATARHFPVSPRRRDMVVLNCIRLLVKSYLRHPKAYIQKPLKSTASCACANSLRQLAPTLDK